MQHTVPEPKDQRANLKRRGSKGGRPACFDKTIYARGSEGERTTNKLKNVPDRGHEVRQRAHVFRGDVPLPRSGSGFAHGPPDGTWR